jgi:Tfp pilus assembly protein PilV
MGKPRKPTDAGFTLLEVMMALVVAMIGLIGTVAVQHTVLRASAAAADSQVATQLAMRTMEELNTRRTQAAPFIDALGPIATDAWTPATYYDAQGRASAAWTPAARWSVRTRVTNTGIARPYNLSVEVSYALDTESPKTTRIDLERRKTW